MALAEPTLDQDLALPRHLGRITLLKLLARGGMGEVYLAASGGIEGAERACVVKVIRREHAKDPSFLARFLDEARVQSQLAHPGVAHVIEASMDNDEPYVVVEHVEGRSLAEVRSRALQLGAKIGWADGVAIGASIAEGMAHVHERVDARGNALGIAHRDLSPQNVMVAFAGETKLIDFGTARGANRRSRTVSGVVYAKPGYVAPEVANGIPGDAAVDVYALGVMVWELCSGRRFLSGDAQEHMGAVGKGERPLPPIAAMIGAPTDLDSVLAKMTAHSKTERATARDTQQLLGQLLSSAPALSRGERGVRARISELLAGLYPHEPKKSRAEFQRLVAEARKLLAAREPAESVVTIMDEEPDPELFGVLPGTRYRLVRALGEGAGGVVHEAVHVDLGRRVALKVLAPTGPEGSARFRREARALSTLVHRGLPQLYDFGVAKDDRLWFAMEYLEGETLERRMAREEIPMVVALRIAADAASALATAHGVGLVHRDIKPSNLFVTDEGALKVLDFGVACAVGEETPDHGQGVAIFGTPEYMAPEQGTPGAVDGRADLYALGAVLYEMLTGRMPIAGAEGPALLAKKRVERPELPSERAKVRRIPRGVDAIVMRALAVRPEDRFADAASMGRELEAAIAEVSALPNRRRSRARVAVAAALVLALGVFGVSAGQRTTAGRDALVAARGKVTAMFRRAPAPSPIVVAEAPVAGLPAALASTEPVAEPAPPPAVEPAKVAMVEEEPEAAEPEKPTAPAASKADLKDIKAKTRRAASKRRWKQAKKLAEEWMKLDASPEPRLALARAMAHIGQPAEAHDVLAAVLEANPACDEARELIHDLDSAKKPAKSPRKTAVARRLPRRPNTDYGRGAACLATTTRGRGGVGTRILMRTRPRFLLAFAVALSAATAHADPYFVDATSTSFPPQPCGPGSSTGCYTNFLVLADVTGDALPDVFFANGGGYYVAGKAEPSVAYQGKGAGIFEETSQSWFAGATSRLRQVAVADVDGDGLLDVYLPGGYGMDPDRLFVQGPAGTFTDRASTLLPAALASRAGAAHFGDVDNDGDLDLVVTDWGDNPSSWMGKSPLPALLHLFLNDGKGVFTAAPDTAIPASPDGKTGNTPIDVDFVDVNGDFALDIVLDNRNGLSRLLINDGKGTFVDAAFPPKKGPYSYNIEACDIDADGDLDLLIDNAAANTGHSTQVLINDGMGTFSDESSRIVGEPNSDDNIVKCADVDGDGAYDLIVASLSNTSEKLLKNDGTAHFTFVADAIPKITDPTLGLDVADIDGDGLLDFVTGQGESTPRLNRVYMGSGASKPDTHAPVLRKIEVPTAMAGMPIPMRVAVTDSHTSEVGQHVREVVLTYTVNASDKPQKVNAVFVGGDFFRGVIPPQVGGSTLSIVVSAKDAAGNVAKSDPIPVMVTGMGGVGGAGGGGGAGGSSDGGAAGTTAGTAGAAGTGDAAGGATAGASGAGTAGAGGSVGGAPSATPPSSDSSGCGCSIPGSASVAPWGLIAALGVLVARRRRKGLRQSSQRSFEEREKLRAFLGRQLERREIGVHVRHVQAEPGAAALRVEVDDLAQRPERSVVEIRRSPRNVT